MSSRHLIVSALSAFGAAVSASEPPVRAELLAGVEAVRPGESFPLGVVFRIAPGWHIYGKNPCDAGMPTRVEWDLPPGFEAGPLLWPVALPFRDDGILSFGYSGEALLFAVIRAPAALDAPLVTLRARAEWLACRSVCVPGRAALELALPARAPSEPPLPSADAPRFAAGTGQAAREDPGWSFALRGRTLSLLPPPGFDPGPWEDAVFIPDDPALVEHAVPARWRIRRGAPPALELRLAASARAASRVEGTLLIREDRAAGALAIRAKARAP